MICNICQNAKFTDMNGRIGVRCTKCNSVERTRLLWMFIEQLDIQPDWKVLHISPEEGIYRKLSEKIAPENYVTADIEPERYRFANCRYIDLTEMEEWNSSEFDLILHVHVMEHIPCNVAYPLFHLHRILKPTGIQLCVIPFLSGVYDECFDDIGDSERARRFGQYDHVRRFGRSGIPMHLGKILKLPDSFDAEEVFGAESLTRYNIPQSRWKGFHTDTVLSLKKDDYRLLADDMR